MIRFRLPYKVHRIDLSKKAQKEPSFLEINPNGRIPALTDTFSDGKMIRVFESGAIMQYLVEQYDDKQLISFPRGTREHYEMLSWLYFVNAGVGPMQVMIIHEAFLSCADLVQGPSKSLLSLCAGED